MDHVLSAVPTNVCREILKVVGQEAHARYCTELIKLLEYELDQRAKRETLAGFRIQLRTLINETSIGLGDREWAKIREALEEAVRQCRDEEAAVCPF